MSWLGTYPREMQTYTHIKACRWMLSAALLTKAKAIATEMLFNG